MQIGTTLPQFQPDVELCLATARWAEDRGLDGVFVFDHLWPLGRPEGNFQSCFPLLGALAVETTLMHIGSLVARVGLAPDAVLVHQLTSLAAIAGPRLIAGMGTGDRLSAPENLAFGIPFPSVAERLTSLEHCVTATRDAGIETWIGAGIAATADVAHRTGATLNLWAVSADEIASARARGPVSWAGQVLIGRDPDDLAAKQERYGDRRGLVQGTVDDVAAHLGGLADAGATWAVCSPLDISEPGGLETLTLVAESLR